MRRALRTLATLAALGTGFGVALAQDAPPPEKPDKPEPEIKILPEAELQRVRGELLRLETERKKLAGETVDLEVRARELERKVSGLPTSPVLTPRKVVVPITVKDTVRRAIGNNPDHLVNALVADAAQEQQEIERALFDPTFQHTTQWAQTNSPNLSNNSFTGLPTGLSKFRRDDWSFQTSLSELFPTGTRVTLSYNDGRDFNNNQFSVNPTYGPRLRADLNQQLLKGFFPNPIDVNLARMRAAESDGEAADAFFAQQLMEAALVVENAYWDVVRAEENLKVAESSLKSANELLLDRRKRRELGAGTGLDITIAEAGVAQRRENMIVAE
ncbi:MAG: TolC family protein, partial [Planctomycetota bacterium]